MALRNILRQKRRSFLTALTIFGGFSLSALSIGWSDGTYSYIINMFTRNRLGHIQIHSKEYLDKPSLYNTINDYKPLGLKISAVKNVTAWAPRVFGSGLVSVGEKSAAVQIIGIDPVLEDKAANFNKKIRSGSELFIQPSREVLLGKGLAGILNAQPGEDLVLVSQGADGSIANDIFKIKGIVDTGDAAADRISCYMNIVSAQDFFALGGRVHELIFIVSDINKVVPIAGNIQAAINEPSLSVQPWQEFAKSFYDAMKADQQGMWITLFIIMLIVAVGVLNTVLMAVLERRREYGLLKALGTTPGNVALLILYEVSMLSIISIIAGTGAGVFVNHLLSIKGISLPHSFTYGGVEFSKMYTEVNARSFIIPAVTVIISALAVSLFPAIKAAKVDPAKAMRTH